MSVTTERWLLAGAALLAALLLVLLTLLRAPAGWLAAVLGWGGAALCTGAALHVVVTGRLRPAMAALVLFAVAGALGVVVLNGASSVTLLFPALLGATLLFAPLPALAITATALLVLALLVADRLSPGAFVQVLGALTGMLVLAHFFVARLRRQRDQLLRLSTVDALTGTLNRRALDARLEEVVNHHRRVPSNQCLLVMDLDGFKNVNDTHGHDRGDALLIQLVTLLRGRIRVTDRLYRYGGTSSWCWRRTRTWTPAASWPRSCAGAWHAKSTRR